MGGASETFRPPGASSRQLCFSDRRPVLLSPQDSCPIPFILYRFFAQAQPLRPKRSTGIATGVCKCAGTGCGLPVPQTDWGQSVHPGHQPDERPEGKPTK